MKTAEETPRIHNFANDYKRTTPRKQTNAIFAEVSERWVANVILSEAACRERIRLPFLEPVRSRAGYILSICVTFIEHTSLDQASLGLGPASQTCALRIACEDTRDGTRAVWVDHHYSDKALIEILSRLGSPEVHAPFGVERGQDVYTHRQLNVQTSDNMIDLRLIEYPEVLPAEPKAFADTEAFEKYFNVGTRVCSYGPGKKVGHCTQVELHEMSDDPFESMDQYYGFLRTAFGNWRVDGVYRVRKGLYEWCYRGEMPIEDSQ